MLTNNSSRRVSWGCAVLLPDSCGINRECTRKYRATNKPFKSGSHSVHRSRRSGPAQEPDGISAHCERYGNIQAESK